MLSFGIEYDRAFSIAFCSARLPAGSGPPSFAATMIARVNFEKSLPRFASAAPFLCLIEDHLLCPDTAVLLLPNDVQEPFVDACVVGQFRMERGHEEPPFAREHDVTVDLGEPVELLGEANLDRLRPEAAQHVRVLAEVPLHSKDADSERPIHASMVTRSTRRAVLRGQAVPAAQAVQAVEASSRQPRRACGPS